MFGEDLKIFRERMGMTQNELAIKTSISKSTIARVEQGIEYATLAFITATSEALGISTTEKYDLILSYFESVDKRLRHLEENSHQTKPHDVVNVSRNANLYTPPTELWHSKRGGYEPERAIPTCAFSVRLEKELYNALYEYSVKTGDSKNKILNKALDDFLKKETA